MCRHLTQVVDAKHKVYGNRKFHFTWSCLMPVLLCCCCLLLCGTSVGLSGQTIPKLLWNKETKIVSEPTGKSWETPTLLSWCLSNPAQILGSTVVTELVVSYHSIPRSLLFLGFFQTRSLRVSKLLNTILWHCIEKSYHCYRVVYLFVRLSLYWRQPRPNICTLFCLVQIKVFLFHLLCVDFSSSAFFVGWAHQ